MAWRPHGHAEVDPQAPSAFGVDDRSGMLHNLRDLTWQFDWRGNRLMNLRILVSARNLDRPQEQLRPIIPPPDPVPVMNSRPENYAAEDAGGIAIEGGATIYYDESGLFYDSGLHYEP